MHGDWLPNDEGIRLTAFIDGAGWAYIAKRGPGPELTGIAASKRERGRENGKYSIRSVRMYIGSWGCDGHGQGCLARAVSRPGLLCVYMYVCARMYPVFWV